MKKYFFTVIIIAFTNISFGQQIYFNNLYPENKSIGFLNLINDSVDYFCLGFSKNLNLSQRLTFSKLKENGDTILNKLILQNDSISYLSGSKSILKLFKNLYFVGTSRFLDTLNDNEDFSKALLLKFNEFGDTIFKKEYKKQNCFRQGFVTLESKLSNNTLILLGATVYQADSINQRQVKVYIANIDTMGNIIWEHEYGYPNQIAVTNTIVAAPDGGYYIPGWIDTEANGIIDYDYYLLKIDSIGNEQWQRQWSHFPNKLESITTLKVLNNGTIIVVGDNISGGLSYRRPFVGKLNSSGIMVEQHFYFLSTGDIGMQRIFEHQGHLMSLVFYDDNSSYRKVALLEYNQNLDSLNTTFFDFNGNQMVYDIIQLPDKGYLLGGFMTNPNNPQETYQNAWLMRIDSNLCANSECIPVGVEEMEGYFSNKNEMKLYPNPTSNIFTISSTNLNLKEVNIFTINGQKIYSKNLLGYQNSLQIETNDWENGFYIVEVLIGKEIYREKLLVIK